jgi:hypothetical protein
MSNPAIKKGAFVRVKNGTQVPDFDDQLMDGWEGEVIQVYQEEHTIEIKWDIKTLLGIPYQYLHDTISGGYDHEVMTLFPEEVEISTKRESSQEEKEQLDTKIHWIDFYDTQEKNQQYDQIFNGIMVSDSNAMFQRWEEYLGTTLRFPFEVEVVELARGWARLGAKIKLLAIGEYDDLQGVLGIGTYNREAITIPLCNLEAVDKDSENYELVNDYVVWFANM